MTAAAWTPGSECTVYTVHALREQLLQVLETAPSPSVDLSDVAEIDGAGLQLLLSARRESARHGGTLRVRALSPAVREALNLVGLQALLVAESDPPSQEP